MRRIFAGLTLATLCAAGAAWAEQTTPNLVTQAFDNLTHDHGGCRARVVRLNTQGGKTTREVYDIACASGHHLRVNISGESPDRLLVCDGETVWESHPGDGKFTEAVYRPSTAGGLASGYLISPMLSPDDDHGWGYLKAYDWKDTGETKLRGKAARHFQHREAVVVKPMDGGGYQMRDYASGDIPEGFFLGTQTTEIWVDAAAVIPLRVAFTSRVGAPAPADLQQRASWREVEDLYLFDSKPSAGDFAFTPPTGAQKVESFQEQAARPGIDSPLVGKPAPDFSLDTLDGKHIALADLRGKVVLLDFWATWCGPCRAALPHTQDLVDHAAPGLVVLTVDVKEKDDIIQKFMQDNRYTYPVLLDRDGAIIKAYGVTGIPSYIIIDRDGTLKAFWVAFPGSASFDAVLKDLGLH